MKTSVIDAKTKERPIIFGGHSIRSILNQTKTQTRRVIKPQPVQQGDFWYWRNPRLDAGYCHTNRDAMEALMLEVCPYGKPGDRLWVREAWLPKNWEGDREYMLVGCPDAAVHPTETYLGARTRAIYEASYKPVLTGDPGKWKNPMFMPRWASRITVVVKSIWVERVQEISEEDAIAEGLTAWSDPPRVTQTHYGESISDVWETDPRKAYWRLWDRINAKRGFPVESNPWIYVIEWPQYSKT